MHVDRGSMLHEICEADLIRQAVSGDRASLSQLLLSHYDDLKRHIIPRITDDLQGVLLPDDVLQETFYRAAQAIRGFEHRSPGSFGAWLKTIAGNLIKDAQKRRRRERRSPTQMFNGAGNYDDSSFVAIIDCIGGDTTSPSCRVHRRDSIGLLRVAMAGLPPDQREVIERYYLRDESLEQIATAMDRSKDAIRGVCYRARQNLRALMGHSSRYFSG
jgi:RNA polymerase sigma factor (sigma-70 family)